MLTILEMVVVLLVLSLCFSFKVSAANPDHVIVTDSQLPDIIYNKSATWEVTLYNQEETDLVFKSLSFTFILDNTEVETFTLTLNETLIGMSEMNKNITITATMPPATYDIIITTRYTITGGSSHHATILKDSASVVAIELLSYPEKLASSPNASKPISVYIINHWEQELLINEFYFKFILPSGSVTYKNTSLNGQWILYGKKWVNTTIITPDKDGNYTISIVCSYDTDIVLNSYRKTSTLSQELLFASIEVTATERPFTLPHNVVTGIIIAIISIIFGAFILKSPLSQKACATCPTTSKSTMEKFYNCCGKTYCRSCALKRKRKCPTCGKLLK